jgi:isopentenyl-diphosphate Delta-isomerase
MTNETECGTERVVLLDSSGAAVGSAPKNSVHHEATPLHLGFSCYVFDTSGALLVTQRSLSKTTWPGVWTNSVCGHPAPGEAIDAGARRRVHEELAIMLHDLQVALPEYRYRAEMTNGVTEYEICPVLTAVTREAPRPCSAEVNAVQWQAWEEFRDDVLAGRREVSPWCADQVRQLSRLAAHPRDIIGDWDALPPAARSTAPVSRGPWLRGPRSRGRDSSRR